MPQQSGGLEIEMNNNTGLVYTSEPKRRNSSLLILSAFLVTYFIYTDFNIRQLLGYAVLCALLLLNVSRGITFTKTKAAFLVLAFVNLLFFLLPNANHDKDTISYMLAMVILAVYLLFSEYDKKTVRWALLVFQMTSIVFMLALLFFRLFPDVYMSHILPMLSDATQEEASIYMSKGYSIPIAGGYTYANYLFALAFSISVGWLFSGCAKRSERLISLATAASALAGVLLMGRRSELAALLAAFCVIAFLYRKRRLTNKKLARLILLPVVLIALVVMFFMLGSLGFLSRYVNTLQQIIANGGAGLSEIFGGSNDITSGRMELWSIAVELFCKFPLFGVGYFRFGDYVPVEFSDSHGRGLVTAVHNDYLQHLCETGIIGTVLWLIPTFYLLWTAIKQARRISRRRDSLPAEVTVLNIVSLGVQIFYAVLGLADPCFYHMTYWSFYTVGIISLQFSLTLEESVNAENAERVTDTEEGASV